MPELKMNESFEALIHRLHPVEEPSVAIFLALLLVIASSSFVLSKSLRWRTAVSEANIEQVLDLAPPSESEEKIDDSPVDDGSPVRVKSLFIYPIKSTHGIELSSSSVVHTGLLYDRQFTFATRDTTATKPMITGHGKIPQDVLKCSTLRDLPRLTLVKTEVVRINGALSIVAKFPSTKGSFLSRLFSGNTATQTFTLPLEKFPENGKYTEERVWIWKDIPTALDYTIHIPAATLLQLRNLLGVPSHIQLSLFRMPPLRERQVFRNAPRAEELGVQPIVGFADSYPVHMLSTSSVRQLGNLIPGPRKWELSHRRFRCNILLENSEAYDEDTYDRIRIGNELTFRIATRCVRCKLPNVDPDTGQKDAVEPDRTLRKHRGNVDKGAKGNACMGVNLVPEPRTTEAGNGEAIEGHDGNTIIGVVRVGDELEVLERGEHVYIPL